MSKAIRAICSIIMSTIIFLCAVPAAVAEEGAQVSVPWPAAVMYDCRRGILGIYRAVAVQVTAVSGSGNGIVEIGEVFPDDVGEGVDLNVRVAVVATPEDAKKAANEFCGKMKTFDFRVRQRAEAEGDG